MRKNISLLIIIALVLQLFNITIYAETEKTIYVAAYGNDSNQGTVDKPVKSLEAASVLAKNLIDSGAENVTVKIHAGKYFVNNTAYAASGVTYEPAGDGEVIFTQTKELSKDGFKRVESAEKLSALPKSARTHILEYDLKADGIELSVDDDFLPYLYVDNIEQIVSKYPNDGYLISAGVTGSKTFTVTDERVYNWKNAFDAYIVGSLDATYFWRIRKVAEISGNSVTLEGNIRNNCEWYIENLFEEIDIPGEYFVDRVEGKLYYYPTGEFETAEIVVNNANILNINNVSDVNIKGITFEKSGGRAIYGTGCSNVNITGCNFKFIQGVDAVRIEGQNCIVSGNYAYGCMGSFVHFEGGIISTLTPGNIVIENNRISFCGRRNFSNVISSGNSISGSLKSCGNIIRNNVIQDCMTFSAIGGKGNDYLIENNEIYNNGYLMDDAGAIYYGKSNIQYGNVIKNNYIHDLNKERSYCGIYPDDGFSGITIVNNVVRNAQKGIIINYGMNNTVEGNMFINTNFGMVGGSVMGRSTPASLYTETYNALTKTVYKDTFKEAYPEMYESILRKPFFAPWNTQVVGNIQIGGATIVLKDRPWHILQDSIDDLPESELNEKGALTYNSGGYQGTNWVSGTKVDELKGYGKVVTDSEGNDLNGTVLGNPAYEYSDSYFVDPENQDYTLNTALNSDISTAGNIDMGIVGIEGDMPGKNGDSVKVIYPLNGDNNIFEENIPFIWESCENASNYRLIVSENSDLSDPVIDKTFIETYSDRIIIESLEKGKTYYYKIYAYGIGKQNTFTAESDVASFSTRTAELYNEDNLIYAVELAENALTKYENDELHYSKALYDELLAEYSNAKLSIASSESTQATYDEHEEVIYEKLANVEKYVNSLGEITKCRPSETTSEIFIEGSNFEPGKMVSVLVTNPGFELSDTDENIDLERIQFASTVTADENGNIAFSFDTIVRGSDMSGEYKVYLSDENGNMYSEAFQYGTIEIGEITAKDSDGNIITDISGYDSIILSAECINRSNIQLKPAVITAFYNNGTLVGVKKTDNTVINPESSEILSWNVNASEHVSDIKVMFMDSVTTLKPLTTSRIIYSAREE